MTAAPAETRAVPRPAKTSLTLPSGAVYTVRPARVSDAPAVTGLIHDAFEVWKTRGLRLGPMSQTVEQTRRHLKGKGVIAVDARGRLVGTFSLDDGGVERTPDGGLAFREGDDVEPYRPDPGARIPEGGRYLVFKKAAVARGSAHSGLGSALYALAERTARERGYDGMVLETVREAGWLYAWYVKLGFRRIGSYRYPGSQVDTVLMIKEFGGSR